MAVDSVFGKINVLGLGSGLDLQGLLDKLRELKEKPIEDLQKKVDRFEKTSQEYDYLNTKLLDLKDKLLDLSLSSSYLGRKVEVSGNAISASADTGALTGTYTVQVNRLAQKSMWQSQGFSSASDSVVSSDDVFSLQVGDQSFSVLVPAGTTLQGLANLINNDENNPGVKAEVINTGEPGTPYHLILTSQTSGEVGRLMVTQELSGVSFSEINAVPEIWRTANYANPTDVVNSTGGPINLTLQVGTQTLSVAVADGATLQDLADAINTEAENAGLSTYLRAYVVRDAAGNYYVEVRSPEDLTVSDDWAGGDLFPNQVSATGETLDAELTVDGVTYRRSSNSINDIIPGVTLNLLSTGTSTVQVSEDYEEVKNLMKDFVEGVSDLLSYIREKSSVDPETGEPGPLYGSDVARDLDRELREIFLKVVNNSSGPDSFLDLGVEFKRDGSITFNEEKFAEALEENPEGVKDLLAGNEDQGLTGLAEQAKEIIDRYLGSGGVLDTAQQALERRKELTEKEIERRETYVEKYMESITRQFIALDSYVQELNNLSAYLDAQFQSVSRQRGNNR
ncbi:MAG TPA: hypothetical protein ENJ40_06750 [Thermosulfurimonas dismutans]|uniref:Flagellar hook-associated protein 2 n=1 Tax=Thermosulfurimonas dismutans TaxID=999894 RepID=A0A7C3GEC2_9BACT|nr:hypothetical protein [Thermosulfurimonas dismutans]